MNLNKYFEDDSHLIGTGPIPETLQDFLKWCGNEDQTAVEKMRLHELEKLPIIKQLHIESIGAIRYLGNKKSWNFYITKESENLRKGEDYISKPFDDYNDAFLSGLILIWQMVIHRKKSI